MSGGKGRALGWEWVAKCRLLGGVPTIELFEEALRAGERAVPLMVDVLARRDFREGQPSDAAPVPVHAMRVLGELRAESALPALVNVVTDPVDPALYGDEAGLALARMGSFAVAPLAGVLADPEHDTWVRVTAARALTFVALADRRLRPRVLEAYERILTDPKERDRLLVAHVVCDACALAASRLVPAVDAAYSAGRVDEDMIDRDSAVGELHRRHQRPDRELKEMARRDVREEYVTWEDVASGLTPEERARYEEAFARLDREGADAPALPEPEGE